VSRFSSLRVPSSKPATARVISEMELLCAPKVLAMLLGIPLNWLKGRTIRCSFMGFLVSKLGWWLRALAFMVSSGLCYNS